MFTVDNEPPVFSNCPSDINQVIPFGSNMVLVQWTAPTVTDNSGVQPNVDNLSQNPGQFTEGNYIITYRATDGTGNSATCIFTLFITQAGRWDYVTCSLNRVSSHTIIFAGMGLYMKTTFYK